MASNIRKRFGDVTGEEEVAADNELDECSKKNKNNKKRERRAAGRQEEKLREKQIKPKLEPVAEGYRSGDLRQEKVIILITLYAVQEG